MSWDGDETIGGWGAHECGVEGGSEGMRGDACSCPFQRPSFMWFLPWGTKGGDHQENNH